jgi:RNA polymerase sigma-70 factor (ECF subfamily)
MALAGRDDVSKAPGDPDNDPTSEDLGKNSQPGDEVGVLDDMGSMALHPGMLDAAPGRGPGMQPEQGTRRYTADATPELTPEQIAARRLAAARGDFSELTDAEVMLELRDGNMAAFDVLLAKYRKPIVHFMFRMVHNQAVAEELAQEVFLRIYRSRETYRAEARFSTWLYRIATNLGVNHARDTRHERSASTVYLDEADGETGTTPDVADSTPSAEAGLLRRERLKAIRQHVMALPERQKTAVLMHKYEGMDYKQIGEVLKLSESATKSLLFRAYQTLREKLKEFV